MSLLRVRPILIAFLCVLIPLALGGCAGGGASDRFEAPAGQYTAAFDAAREVLREYRFDLERIDARGGVITTRSKQTSGFATPWDAEQSSLRSEWEDLLNRQRRRVRIVFAPTAGDVDRTVEAFSDGARPEIGPVSRQPAVVDLVAHSDSGGSVCARVVVVVERVQEPGFRPEPRGIRQSTATFDPALAERGMSPAYAVYLDDDLEFASRLADRIRARVGAAVPATDATPASPIQ
jgi:hypothetical protein